MPIGYLRKGAFTLFSTENGKLNMRHKFEAFPCGADAAKKNILMPKKTVPFRPSNFSQQTLKLSILIESITMQEICDNTHNWEEI